MERIKEWFSSHEILSAFLFVVALNICLSKTLDFFSKTYEKFYINEYSYELAISEFERICDEYDIVKEDEYEAEYHKSYINKDEAINDFMDLALVCDGLYANGKLRHWYISSKERVYRCQDKDRNLIAIRFIKHKRYGINWKPTYELQFFVEKY